MLSQSKHGKLLRWWRWDAGINDQDPVIQNWKLVKLQPDKDQTHHQMETWYYRKENDKMREN